MIYCGYLSALIFYPARKVIHHCLVTYGPVHEKVTHVMSIFVFVLDCYCTEKKRKYNVNAAL